MFWIWFGIILALGMAGYSLYLRFFVDHRIIQQLWDRLRELEQKVRQWEGWGRLVCTIAADANLELPDPPDSIDEADG